MKASKWSIFGLLFINCLLINVVTSNAQGIFLKKGMSGFGLQGGFSSAENIIGLSAGVGYSANGIFDIGFSVGRLFVDDNVIGDNLSVIGLAPSLTVHFLKQDKQIPFSLFGFGGYERDNFSADVLDQNGLDLFTDSFFVGGGAYSNIAVTPRLDLIPVASFTYITTEATVKDNSGNSISESDNSTGVGLGLSFGIKNDSGNIFYVTPAISLSEGNNGFSLSLGYVFVTANGKINSTQYPNRQPSSLDTQRQSPQLRSTPAVEKDREIVGKITKVVGNYAVVKLNSNIKVFEGMRLDVYEPEYLFDSNISKVCSVNVFKVTTAQAALEIIENDNNGNLQVGQLVVMPNK